jgi:hypothetical protein
VLGACWIRRFWVSFGNHTEVYHVTFWQRSSTCENHFVHFKELACKRRKLVKIFGTFFPLCNHVVIGLALIEYYKYLWVFLGRKELRGRRESEYLSSGSYC